MSDEKIQKIQELERELEDLCIHALEEKVKILTTKVDKLENHEISLKLEIASDLKTQMTKES